MKRLISTLTLLILLVQIVPAVSAKQKGDWSIVKTLVDRSVAVKTKTGEIHFGLVRSADDSSVTIQIAGHEDFTSQEINFRRDDVTKVWQAKLRFRESNLAKGTLIGVGAGVGVAVVASMIIAARGDADPPAGGWPVSDCGRHRWSRRRNVLEEKA